MKRFDSEEALAKEFGLSPAFLKKTFDDYNLAAKTKTDKFAKKVRLYLFLLVRHTDISGIVFPMIIGPLTTPSMSP